VLLLSLENSVPVRMAITANSEGTVGVRRIVRQTILLVVAVFAPLLAMSALFGDLLMRRIYGTAYESYGNLVVWWMAINFVSAISIPVKSALRTFEMPKSIFVAQVVSSLIALGGTFEAVRRFGMLGGPIILLFALIVFNCGVFFPYAKSAKSVAPSVKANLASVINNGQVD